MEEGEEINWYLVSACSYSVFTSDDVHLLDFKVSESKSSESPDLSWETME